MPSNIKKKRK